ncbi:hypothetical protein [uncultured Methylobacterium sp.]|uniref:hypothetical protein n=1 Tax=uncultured Methylobacterium sp. TaxID=157278 RepID=UPI0035CBD55C
MTDAIEVPTRGGVLARYRPIRASVQAVLRQAVRQCKKPDFDRAAKHLDLVDDAQLDDEETFAMLCDVALFEPNQRRRRVIDGFLARHIDTVAPTDREVARRLGSAFLSIFRVAGWHEAGGVWLDDLLDAERRIWLMDEGLEASAPEGLVVALRVFDAGPFHCGFGIVVQPDEEAVAFCTAAAVRGHPMPVRHSLAAALYGDAIVRSAAPVAVEALMDLLDEAEASLTARPEPILSRRSKVARKA